METKGYIPKDTQREKEDNYLIDRAQLIMMKRLRELKIKIPKSKLNELCKNIDISKEKE